VRVNVGGTDKLPMSDLNEFCEELGFGAVYIHCDQGMAASKLVIAAAKSGTARNMNTVATLARMAAEF
jgi:uncharacterized protein (DUF1697 family)